MEHMARMMATLIDFLLNSMLSSAAFFSSPEYASSVIIC